MTDKRRGPANVVKHEVAEHDVDRNARRIEKAISDIYNGRLNAGLSALYPALAEMTGLSVEDVKKAIKADVDALKDKTN